MLYRNLTVKELYASIYDTQTIESFFLKGLEKDNDRLAVSAMEELILRGDTDKVFEGLKAAFERGDIKVESTMATMIARSLSESCRGVDPFLHKFGKFLFKAEGSDPFKEFAESCDTDAIVRRFGKYLNLDEEDQKKAELMARELRRNKEAKSRIDKLAEDSFRAWIHDAIAILSPDGETADDSSTR